MPEKLRALEVLDVIEWTPDSLLESIAAAIYHQGDPGTASYAAVPHLIRIAECRSPAEKVWLVYLVVGLKARVVKRARRFRLISKMLTLKLWGKHGTWRWSC